MVYVGAARTVGTVARIVRTGNTGLKPRCLNERARGFTLRELREFTPNNCRRRFGLGGIGRKIEEDPRTQSGGIRGDRGPLEQI